MSPKTWVYFKPLWLAIVLVILMAAGLTSPSRAAQTSPTPTAAATASSNSRTFAFDYMQMADAKHGWALADAFLSDQDLAAVLHTADGGKTWKDVSPPGFSDTFVFPDVGAYFFLDDSHAWLGAQNTLWRSQDGGQSWDTITIVPIILEDTLLDFVDPNFGWLMWFDACQSCIVTTALYHTTDGGALWGKMNGNDGSGLEDSLGRFPQPAETEMIFDSSTDGWMFRADVPGYTYRGQTFGNVRHTSNSGRTWTDPQIPPPPGKTSLYGCHFEAPFVFHEGSLTSFVRCDENDYKDNQALYIYHTDDEGQTWQIVSSDILLDWIQIRMVSPKFGFELGSPRNAPNTYVLRQTLDGGKTWKNLPPLPDVLITGQYEYRLFFDFLDQHTGWAIDDSGNLEFTHDSGKSWTPLNAQVAP